jgi:phenylacetate-CoA ligase
MGVANECPAHAGLHISSEHVVVEVVDEKGEKVSDGEYGQLAITDLDNYTMPFIRYINGDNGRLLKGKCTCGRSLPVMDYVSGRSVDIIKGVNGTIAHGLYFVTLLKESGLYDSHNILDYEIVQRENDVLDCNFVLEKDPSPAAVDAFKNACRDNFGDMTININCLDKIPKTVSGKRRFIRSEIITD